MKRLSNQRPGVVTTVTVLAVTGVVMAAFLTLTTLSTSQLAQVRETADSEQVFFAAEGGLNHGLKKLIASAAPGSYSLAINGAAVDVEILIDPTDPIGKRRIVTSTARLAGKERRLTITANTNSIGGHLEYALQSGNGGIELDNNSAVHGNLYSNGSVIGQNKNAITVYGDIWSACPPADRPACPNSLIRRVTVGTPTATHHTHAAHYDDVIVAAPGIQETTTTLDPAPYPFTQQKIDEFKNIADDVTQPLGDVTVNGDLTLDAQKIQGNLVINSGTLTLNGPVWVTGIIDMKPNVRIRLPASAGENSGVLMTDQTVNIENNAELAGSGNPKSFLLVISFKADLVDPVIIAANNSTAVVYFAPAGLIEVRPAQGGGLVNNVTGEKIHLRNNAQVQFNANLAGFSIPAGNPIPIGINPGSWNEL